MNNSFSYVDIAALCEKYNVIQLMFIPHFRPVREKIHNKAIADFFLEDAFSMWEESFAEALGQIFGYAFFHLLEELAGKMTMPTKVWLQKAAPIIFSGELFREAETRYPIAAQQIGEFSLLQEKHVQEVITAITEELPKVYNNFFPGEVMVKVKQVSAAASDRHNGGRCVHIVTFENGHRIVYKPHSVKLDEAFAGWINFLANRAGEEKFYFPHCCDTVRGGFCEYIERRPLKAKKDASIFFERFGFLIGSVYLLHGNDLHAENIIAHESDPVIIDTETILAPEGCLLQRAQKKNRHYSVQSLSAFPMMGTLPGFYLIQAAALCNVFQGSQNLPVWKGNRISGNEYPEEIFRGFEKCVRAALQNQIEAEETLTKCFSGCQIRMVLRPTSVYMKLMIGLGNRNCQEDTALYQQLMDIFALKPGQINKDITDLINKTETEALSRLDVPYFSETLTEPMLRSFSKGWRDITDKTLKREHDRIVFSLTAPAPYAGNDQLIPVKSVPKSFADQDGFIKHLRELALYVLGLLSGEKIPLVVSREQTQYCENEALTNVFCLLDGNLGAIVALSAWLRINPDDEIIMPVVESAVKTLVDSSRSAPGMTATAPGLADGCAGYILGSYLCYQLGTLTEAEFFAVLKNAEKVVEDELKLKYSSDQILYGCPDLVFVLGKLPERFLTDGIRRLLSKTMNRLETSHTFEAMSAEEITRLVREHIVAPVQNTTLSVCKNESLRYGNAGKLLLYTEKKNMRRDKITAEEEDGAFALSRHLVQSRHIVSGYPIADDCLETGLFHGMPGVLFALCRYLAPDRVPGIL